MSLETLATNWLQDIGNCGWASSFIKFVGKRLHWLVKKLLGAPAPGIATSNKKLLEAPGLTTRSKDGTRGSCLESLRALLPTKCSGNPTRPLQSDQPKPMVPESVSSRWPVPARTVHS